MKYFLLLFLSLSLLPAYAQEGPYTYQITIRNNSGHSAATLSQFQPANGYSSDAGSKPPTTIEKNMQKTFFYDTTVTMSKSTKGQKTATFNPYVRYNLSDGTGCVFQYYEQDGSCKATATQNGQIACVACPVSSDSNTCVFTFKIAGGSC